MLQCSLSRKHKFSSHICDAEWGIKSQTSGRSYCLGPTTLLNLPTGQSKFCSLKAFKESMWFCLYVYMFICPYIVELIYTYVCSFFNSGGGFFFFLQVLQEVEELLKVKKEPYVWS